ncbi:MAG: DUF3426 domain-containing protein [Desulfonatronovibrio sp.]
MIVQCPNCSTKYNFDDSKFQNEVKVRCTRCQHVFKLSALNEEDSSDDFSEDDFSLGASSGNKKQDIPKPEWDPDDMNIDITPAAQQSQDRKTLMRNSLIALCIIIILALGAYLAYTRLDGSLNIPFVTPEEEEPEEQTEFTEEDVKDISLDNIRQYFVSNDKIGQLFVIEGQAVNNFQEPKSMIKLKASLYDDQGSVVVEKEFLCGNVASLFQLQVSDQEELESTLQARLGILTSNKLVEPDNHVPFMTVFYNPPEEVQEFGLEVIEVRDPTP